MDDNELWAKITSTFFRKVETPSSDFFVSRVMARIEEQDSDWRRWLVPSFGLGFAALFFVMTFTSARADLMADTEIDTDVVMTDVLEGLS